MVAVLSSAVPVELLLDFIRLNDIDFVHSKRFEHMVMNMIEL